MEKIGVCQKDTIANLNVLNKLNVSKLEEFEQQIK